MNQEAATLRPVLVFHKLLDRFSYGATNFSPSRFERLMVTLLKSGWYSASPGEALSERERGVVVSFDDGYHHLADVLPDLIARLDLRPVIFVPTELIGRPNRWDYSYRWRPTPHLDRAAIRRLAELPVTFGSHGGSHTDLTLCRPAHLSREVADSRKLLQDLTGQAINSISYPFGRFNNRVLAAVQDAGYRHGFTMRFPHRSDTPLTWGRLPVYGFDTIWSVCQKLERGPAYQLERFKARIVNRLSGGTVLLNRLRRQPRD